MEAMSSENLHSLEVKFYLQKDQRWLHLLLRHKAGQEERGEILLENSFMR